MLNRIYRLLQDKRYAFLALVSLTGIYVLLHSIPWPGPAKKKKKYPVRPLSANEKVIQMDVYQQQRELRRIDDPMETVSCSRYQIDRIAFRPGTELVHYRLGALGFSENFFVVCLGRFKVLVPGRYTFIVYSDDGFRLWIDDNKLMEFLTDRPLRPNQIDLELKKGVHTFRLKYFQGGANLGLRAYYRPSRQLQPRSPGQRFLIGQDSSFFKFVRLPDKKKKPGKQTP